ERDRGIRGKALRVRNAQVRDSPCAAAQVEFDRADTNVRLCRLRAFHLDETCDDAVQVCAQKENQPGNQQDDDQDDAKESLACSCHVARTRLLELIACRHSFAGSLVASESSSAPSASFSSGVSRVESP